MKKIAYQGPFNARVLNSDDVQPAGVEAGVFKKTEFLRREPVEVDDSVAEALLGNPKRFGKFKEVNDEKSMSAEGEEAEVEVGEATTSGSDQESTGTPSGGATGARTAGSTGRSTTGSASRTRS